MNPRADVGTTFDAARSYAAIRGLTCLMFLCFAMTTDAVGSVIPELIRKFRLSLTAAGAFHYVPMSAIALGALMLGFLADRLGRKPTILLGLALYGASCLAFAFTERFAAFLWLLAVSGLGVSLFKIGALALVGDLSQSTRQHAANMNLIEGFFGVGSIAGPALVAVLLAAGMSWKWLYVMAAAMCALLIVLAGFGRYPPAPARIRTALNLQRILSIIRSPYSLGFSALIMFYVATEVAIYVWMPTYLGSYQGGAGRLAPYALTAFFLLRAGGRFAGVWMLGRYSWSAVLAVASGGIFTCFSVSLLKGPSVGVFLLPLSGLFMSVVYPTLNSKGISCFDRAEHGCIAGVILFFTAVAAAGAPFAMAAVGDLYGGSRYGFVLADGFAFMLFVGLLVNWLFEPADGRLNTLNGRDYSAAAS